MALTAPQLASLQSVHQRARCKFVVLPTWYAEGLLTYSLGSISWLDLVNIYPRHSWADNSASIVLDGNDSITHAKAAASGHTWSLTAGSGSLVDNSDGTATYTAPASGSGIASIRLRTSGNVQDNMAYVAYGSDEQTVAEVVAFHADVSEGGWGMTVRVMGDCDDFDRGAGILLVLDDYWNGSESTFGGYKWGDGVFYGYVSDPRKVYEDASTTWAEFIVESPEKRLRVAALPEVIFATTDSGEELVDASLKVMDVCYWFLQNKFNQRHNVWIFDDPNDITNLKLSPGPMWDVLEDVAKRCFCALYASRQGDVYIVPDPVARWPDYSDSGPYGPPKYTNELTFTTSLFESILVTDSVIPTGSEGGPAESDLPVQQVVFSGVQGDLTEIWARFPSDVNRPSGGKVEKVSGIICGSAVTLETWAGRYWYHLQGVTEADLAVFLFHHVDLYEPVGLTFTPNANRVTNTGIALDNVSMYVSAVDYEINPGLGTWRGNVHLTAYPTASPEDWGENSAG